MKDHTDPAAMDVITGTVQGEPTYRQQPDGHTIAAVRVTTPLGQEFTINVHVPEDVPAPPQIPPTRVRFRGHLDPQSNTMEAHHCRPAHLDHLTVLAAGGREFNNYTTVLMVLDRMGPDTIVHGAARGADSLADRYAREHHVSCRRFPVKWRDQQGRYKGPQAGHDRNQQMLDQGRPDIVVTFPGGPGSQDMARRSRQQDFPVHVIDHQGSRLPGNPQVVPV